MKTIAHFALISLILIAINGCGVMVLTAEPPSVDLNTLHNFYIVKSEFDDRGIGKKIAAGLVLRGKTVTIGSVPPTDDSVDAVLTYQFQGFWGVLYHLNIELRDPKTNYKLTSGYYLSDIWFPSPETAIQKVFDKMYAEPCSSTIFACALVPMAPIENDTFRKSFPEPSPGTAGLYIYRNALAGSVVKKDFFLDGVQVAESAPLTYFYLEVDDGTRRVSAESEFSPNDLIVEVEQGRNYFIRHFLTPGALSPSVGHELVSEKEGKNGVLQCKLANNINGNRLFCSGQEDTSDSATQADSEGVISVCDFYGQAEEEVKTQRYNHSLWVRALVEADGNEKKSRARYVELRAYQLYNENTEPTSTNGLN